MKKIYDFHIARQAANAKPLQFLSVCKFQWVLQLVQGYLWIARDWRVCLHYDTAVLWVFRMCCRLGQTLQSPSLVMLNSSTCPTLEPCDMLGFRIWVARVRPSNPHPTQDIPNIHKDFVTYSKRIGKSKRHSNGELGPPVSFRAKLKMSRKRVCSRPCEG